MILIRCAIIFSMLSCAVGDDIEATMKQFVELTASRDKLAQHQAAYRQEILKTWGLLNHKKAIVPAVPKDPRESDLARYKAAEGWNSRVDNTTKIFREAAEVDDKNNDGLRYELYFFIRDRENYQKAFPADAAQLGPLIASESVPEKKKGTIKAKLADGTEVQE